MTPGLQNLHGLITGTLIGTLDGLIGLGKADSASHSWLAISDSIH